MQERVAYVVDFTERRNRLTTLVRLLLAIPQYVVLFFYGVAAFVAVVVAWFALVLTGRWPAGLYDFVAGFARWSARVQAYAYLLVDAYPPFDGGEHPEYAARLVLAPRQPLYSRLKALFRIVLYVPVYIINYVLGAVAVVLGVVSWLVILFTGQQREGLHGALRFCVSYGVRAGVYAFLLTEDWPAISDEPAAPPTPFEAPEHPGSS
jgi:Domain of unknown function (DUF4389)